MSKLFVRPSQVVARLRSTYTTIKAKQPLFPVLEIKAVSGPLNREEVADSDAEDPASIRLYVGSGLASGSLVTDAGMGITDITNGISIALTVGTRDEHAQYADELQTIIKEFVIISLHGWIWQDGDRPLRFSTESGFTVKGKALLLRQYDFIHNVDVEYSVIDDAFDLFDSLDDFLLLKGDMEAVTQGGDTATVPHEIVLPGPA